MRNFQSYTPEKYSKGGFTEIEDGVYQTKDPYGNEGDIYVTSLTFEMENECYGEEDGSPKNLPQVQVKKLIIFAIL